MDKMCSVGCILLSLCAVNTRAQGLSFADNRIFPHGYVDFSRAGPLAVVDYPFARVGRQLIFETSYRSLYDMKELTDNRAGLAYTIDRFQLGGAVATFGEPDYFSQVGLAACAGYHLSSISFGAAVLYSRIGFNDTYDPLSVVTFNIGGSYGYDLMTIFAAARAVNQPRRFDGDEPVRPKLEIGISYRTDRGLDSQAKALFEKYQKPTAELSQSFQVAEFFSVSWSLVLLPARFGAGLSLEKGAFGFGYALSHHPVLGVTHAVRLALSVERKSSNDDNGDG